MLTLQILDFSFQKLAEITQFESLQITRSFFGTGGLRLTVDPRAGHADALVPDAIVCFGDKPDRAFVIEDILSHTRTALTLSGCMLKGLAKRRVCVPPAAGGRPYQDFGWDRFTGTAEDAYLHYAAANLFAPEDPARAMENLVPAASLQRGEALPWQARFSRLDVLLSHIGEATGLGWDIRPDFAQKQFVFTAWEGHDRTQGDALCLISEESGNAADVTLRQLRSGSAGTLYAGGAGEDEDRFILCRGGEAQGAARRELWAEAGSLADPELLSLYAQNRQAEAGVKTTLTAALIDSGACRYGREYDVGDRVLVSGRGAHMAARLIEMTETYEGGKRTLHAVFGDAPVTVGKLLRASTGAAR